MAIGKIGDLLLNICILLSALVGEMNKQVNESEK